MTRATNPSILKIAGLTWPVRLRATIKHEGADYIGLCRPTKQDLLIHRDLAKTPEQARRVLLHEALHAMLWETEHFHDEALIDRLTERVDMLYADNLDFRGMY